MCTICFVRQNEQYMIDMQIIIGILNMYRLLYGKSVPLVVIGTLGELFARGL